MSVAVEQHTRAEIVSDTAQERRAVPVDLRYDPESAPRSVCLRLSGPPGSAPHDWVFARELLEKGLRTPVGRGDVRVWPCGRVSVVVELHSAQGVSLIQFDSAALSRFLRRTYAAALPVSHLS
jgi:hypothetical protein